MILFLWVACGCFLASSVQLLNIQSCHMIASIKQPIGVASHHRTFHFEADPKKILDDPKFLVVAKNKHSTQIAALGRLRLRIFQLSVSSNHVTFLCKIRRELVRSSWATIWAPTPIEK